MNNQKFLFRMVRTKNENFLILIYVKIIQDAKKEIIVEDEN